MSNWKIYLKKQTLDWLLEDDNPSVKYYTLICLLDKDKNSSQIKSMQSKIMKEDAVKKILNKQHPEGFWEDPYNFYLPKDKATVFKFYNLVDLAADRTDEKIRKTCEYLLANSQNIESGAFSHYSYEGLRQLSKKNMRSSERVMLKNLGHFSDKLKGGSNIVLPCLTGQMIYSLIRFGYLEDDRIQKGINWIVRYQRFDDGETRPEKIWPYKLPILKYGDSCWGKHTCHKGVVLILKALAEIPGKKRSKEVKRVIERGAEHLLKHHIYKRSHDLNKVSIPYWLRFGYPDINTLTALLLLTKLGYRDDRMEDALNLLTGKQNSNGRWVAEKNGYERKGTESKWITLNALRTMKYIYS